MVFLQLSSSVPSVVSPTQHQARKRFGQNFLTDKNLIGKIISSIAPQPDDLVVEIGPGRGALTQPLLQRLNRLHVVELDRDLIPQLQQNHTGPGELVVHQADALKFDFAQLANADKPMRLVGNLPYNISTPLLFHLLDYAALIKDMYFMLQKEVVDRLAAGPGDEDYGRLSVMVQYFCQVIPLFTVPPTAFKPSPKVYSRIVRLIPHGAPPYPVDRFEDFAAVVKQAFAQRRKTLRNTLKPLLPAERILALDIDPGTRAETLGLADFVLLANAYSRFQANCR